MKNEWCKRVLDAWNAGATLTFALIMEQTVGGVATDVPTADDGIVYVADFANLAESDAGDYSRVEATNITVERKNAENRAQLSADTIVFSGMSAYAAHDYVGILALDNVANDDAQSPVVGYFAFTNGPLSKQATQIDIPIDAEDGLIQVSQNASP